MPDPHRWTEQLAGIEARQRDAVREGREAEAEGRPVIYIHGRPYADPGAEAPDPKPPRTPKEARAEAVAEGAASAGAKAEAAGRPASWNPYKRPGPLRDAWAAGWAISRTDREQHGPTGDAP